VAATGKPLIIVLTNGSSARRELGSATRCRIVEAWYPGEKGRRRSDVLSGDYILREGFQSLLSICRALPPFDNYSMAGRTYRYFTEPPLYPFGYGLSFSSFNYSDARVSQAKSRQMAR